MRRTEMLQEIRRMRFEEVYFGWTESRLSQEEAARILGVSERTFRLAHAGTEYFRAMSPDGFSSGNTGNLLSCPVERSDAQLHIHCEDAIRNALKNRLGRSCYARLRFFLSQYHHMRTTELVIWVKQISCPNKDTCF